MPDDPVAALAAAVLAASASSVLLPQDVARVVEVGPSDDGARLALTIEIRGARYRYLWPERGTVAGALEDPRGGVAGWSTVVLANLCEWLEAADMGLDDALRSGIIRRDGPEDRRVTLLRRLIAADGSPDAIATELATFGWDSDEDLVDLHPRDVAGLLWRYVDGDADVDAGFVEAWANRLEGREDIGFSAGAEELLRQAVFELANPALGHVMSPGFARGWIGRLQAAG